MIVFDLFKSLHFLISIHFNISIATLLIDECLILFESENELDEFNYNNEWFTLLIHDLKEELNK